jgi:D-alanine-D-alanine ligase
MKKIRVGVLFGGRSGEHEVSLLSAASVLKALDRKKYEVVPIGITRSGQWVTAGAARDLLESKPLATEEHLRAGDPATTPGAAVLASGEGVIVPPVPAKSKSGSGVLVPFETGARSLAADTAHHKLQLDVVLPVLHGTFGEDGTIQGLLELAGIAYVGSGVLGSAAGMDKDVMKRLFASARLPLVRHVTFLRQEWEKSPAKLLKKVETAVRYPVFVKPANLGSSVGISKAKDRKELKAAITLAAKYDRKILVEQGVGGRGRQGKARELEVAVLGNDDPQASIVGEIIPSKEFYDYEAKYLSEGSIAVIPAKLSRDEQKQIREMAVRAFQACDCAGMARVDFLKEPGPKGRIYLNEVNTLPGFTSISMYPKLWEATGLPLPKLIDRLIALAQERRAEKDRNQYSL